MRLLTNIIRGYGVSKTVGRSQSGQFLTTFSSNRNIWFSKRRYEH